MKKLMTRRLALQFNWKGRGEKRGFSKMNLWPVVTGMTITCWFSRHYYSIQCAGNQNGIDNKITRVCLRCRFILHRIARTPGRWDPSQQCWELIMPVFDANAQSLPVKGRELNFSDAWSKFESGYSRTHDECFNQYATEALQMLSSSFSFYILLSMVVLVWHCPIILILPSTRSCTTSLFRPNHL